MNKTMKILMVVFGFLLMFGLVFGETIVTTARDYLYQNITITADPKVTNEMLGITDEKAQVPPEQAIQAYANVGIEAKTRQEIAITRQSITEKVNKMFFSNDLDGLRKADECVKAINAPILQSPPPTYFCYARNLTAVCLSTSVYYGLPTGKCTTSSGSLLCSSGWVIA